MRGRKPKPVALHVVDGTLNTTRHKDLANAPVIDGRPVMPKCMSRQGKVIWEQYFDVFTWLTVVESHLFAIWCELTVDYADQLNAKNRQWNAALLGRYQSIGADLGVGHANRLRIPGDKGKPSKNKSKFFNNGKHKTD